MKTKSIIMAVVLAVPSLTLMAQDAPGGAGGPGGHGGPGGPGGRGPRRGPSPIVAALDVNKDGVIDASEIANASAVLLTLDKNNDGKLGKDEMHPARPAGAPPEGGKKDGQGGPGAGPAGGPDGGPGHNRPMPPLIAALDANQDGEIDGSEIANAPAALKTLDKNGDGQLTQDELRPARPEGAPQDGGAQQGHRKQRPQQ